MSWDIDVGGTSVPTFEVLEQVLNGKEYLELYMGNTPAFRALVDVDRATTLSWETYTVFSGMLKGSKKTRGDIRGIVYDTVHEALANSSLFTNEYSAEQADTIMTAVLAGTGIGLGECPTTNVSVRFDRAIKLFIAEFMAKWLRKDLWTSGGDTINIGQKGSCYLQLKMDEGAGTSYVYDTSGMEYNFAFPGGVADPTWVTGKFGNGLSFDGGDYLSRASKVIDTDDDFTVVFYVNPDGVAGNQYIMMRGTGWYVRLSGDEIEAWVDCATVDANYVTNNANLSAGGGYYRIAVVYDQSEKTFKIFKNGTECTYGTSQAGDGAEVNGDTTVYIGRDTAGANYLSGDLDEIQVFQRALIDKEVEMLDNMPMYNIPQDNDPMESQEDRGKQKNHCVVIGTDSSGNTIVGEAYVDATTGVVMKGTPPGGFTYRSMRKVEKGATDTATLNTKAASYLDSTSKSTVVKRVYAAIDDVYCIETGDYVVAQDTELGLADVYRVVKRRVSLGWVELHLDNTQKRTEDHIVDFSQYEDYGIYVAIEEIPEGMQNWTSDIVFSAVDYNTASWAAGTITFADGDTLAINAGNTGNLAAGWWWVYFTAGSATLQVTQTESDAVSPTTGILAKLYVGTDTSQDIMIETFGNAQGTVVSRYGVGVSAVYAAAMQPGIQPYTVDIDFVPMGGNEHNRCSWDAGTIYFADGSSQAINAGNVAAIPDGATRYLYFTEGSTTLTLTADYNRVVLNSNRGLVCKLFVSTDTDQQIAINPYKGKMENVVVDQLGAKAVNTVILDSSEIYGKDIATQQNVGVVGGNAGIRIIGDDADVVGTAIGDSIGGNFTAGIWGFKAGPARTFYLDPTTGQIIVYGDSLFTIKKSDGTTAGYLDGTVNDLGLGAGNQDTILLRAATTQLVGLQSHGRWFFLDGANSRIVVDDAWDKIIPQVDKSVGLGDGTRNFLIRLPLYNGADPAAPVEGEIWVRQDL